MKEYPIPAGPLEREIEVKKSRFIARVFAVSNRDEVRERVDEARTEFPDANHVCWAYQLGAPGSAVEAAMNDDGEPSGTAGKPILGVIQHKDMGDVLVIVIRYFGGVKLGAGGLVRAYSGAAESVLSAVDAVVQPALEEIELTMDFSEEQAVRHWCQQNKGSVKAVDYAQSVIMQIEVPESELGELSDFCASKHISMHRE